MIYYTSDVLFSDEKILKVCRRPFDSVKAMDEGIIEKWNGKVSDGDAVYILGDVFPCICDDSEKIIDCVKKPNGKKTLIAGNHNEKFLREVVLCHYPLMTWQNDESSIHLYGHIHNKEFPEMRRLKHIMKNTKEGELTTSDSMSEALSLLI